MARLPLEKEGDRLAGADYLGVHIMGMAVRRTHFVDPGYGFDSPLGDSPRGWRFTLKFSLIFGWRPLVNF